MTKVTRRERRNQKSRRAGDVVKQNKATSVALQRDLIAVVKVTGAADVARNFCIYFALISTVVLVAGDPLHFFFSISKAIGVLITCAWCCVRRRRRHNVNDITSLSVPAVL